MAVDEKRFVALGQEWTARFDFNSVCELEESYGRPFLAIVAPMLGGLDEEDADNPAKQVEAASRIRMSDVRKIMHEALRAHHHDVTLQGVGDIIGDVGLATAMDVVAWAVLRALPQDKGGNGKPAKNPR